MIRVIRRINLTTCRVACRRPERW